MKYNSIEKAYQIASDLYPELTEDQRVGLVQIGMQMAISDEVIMDDTNNVVIID